jgi:glycerate-2-kinase
MNKGAFLKVLFEAAVAAAGPSGKFAVLPDPPSAGRTIVLGAGKAAASMAAEFERVWERPIEGLVVTRYKHGCPTRHVEVVEAGHPVPDAEGHASARRILEIAKSATEDDLVVFLGSGGASSLLTLPLDGIAHEDKRNIGKALLRSGAPIDEMNTVRKALSAIKAGRLAAAIAPARCVTYLISDVPGDDPGVIGSGPTIAAETDAQDALEICARRGIEVPAHVREVMLANTVPQFRTGPVHMLATPQDALEAAAALARSRGIVAHILGSNIEGEAREAAMVFAGIADQVSRLDQPFEKPCVLISGGETNVSVKGNGRGGRNTEFQLALALALGGMPDVSAIACDTDGIDGVDENAGALVFPDTLARMTDAGVDVRAMLNDNNSLAAFEAIGQVVTTGPTLTNVNDFRAILIE